MEGPQNQGKLRVEGSVFVVDARYYESRGITPPTFSGINDDLGAQKPVQRFDTGCYAFDSANPVLGREMRLPVRNATTESTFVSDMFVVCKHDTPRADLSFISPSILGSRRIQMDPLAQQQQLALDDRHTIKIAPSSSPDREGLVRLLPFPVSITSDKQDLPLGVLLSTLAGKSSEELLTDALVQPGIQVRKARFVLAQNEIDDPDAKVVVIHCMHLLAFMLGSLAKASGVSRIFSFLWPRINEQQQSAPTRDLDEPYHLIMPLDTAKRLVEQVKSLRDAIRSSMSNIDKASVTLARAVVTGAGVSVMACPTDSNTGKLIDPAASSALQLGFGLRFVLNYMSPRACPDLLLRGHTHPPPPFFDAQDLRVYSCLRKFDKPEELLVCVHKGGSAARMERNEMVMAAFHKFKDRAPNPTAFNEQVEKFVSEALYSAA